MPAFLFEKAVRFGDVDHAGIVYYPRFFHYFHVAFEEMFGEGRYLEILDNDKIGFPAVRLECDFRKPLRFGDKVTIAVSVDHLGDKSARFHYRLWPTGKDATELSAEAKITCVAVELQTFRSKSIPDDLRDLFQSLRTP